MAAGKAYTHPHKSQKIAETIARWFAEGKYRPGDQFPSDQELARRFGVNHVTARTALKRFVDAGMLERRVGAGTVVRDPQEARRKEDQSNPASRGVALAVPDATHSFFSEMLRAVEAALLGSGRPLLFGHTWELGQREEQVVNAWLAQGVRRMVQTPPISEGAFYNGLLDQGVRLVFVDRRVEGVDVPSIVSRDEEGMAAVVRYVLQLGHKRLCHLAGPGSIWTARQRRETFERTVQGGRAGGPGHRGAAGRVLHRGRVRGAQPWWRPTTPWAWARSGRCMNAGCACPRT
jgi:GntR family transcriptional regulator of arabinose operon